MKKDLRASLEVKAAKYEQGKGMEDGGVRHVCGADKFSNRFRPLD